MRHLKVKFDVTVFSRDRPLSMHSEENFLKNRLANWEVRLGCYVRDETIRVFVDSANYTMYQLSFSLFLHEFVKPCREISEMEKR